jgi:hypothetical protein
MNECCQQPENRRDGPGLRGAEEREGLSVTHCVVCECRHFDLEVDPLEIGIEGQSL